MTIVYIGCADDSEIHILRLDPERGGLTTLAVARVPSVVEAGRSLPLAISPDKRFLYAAIRGKPFIVACYAINRKTGALAHIGDGPLDDSLAYIATDRSGRFLLGASYSGAKLTVNPISANGVALAPTQVVASEPNAHAILADPANRFVLAPCLGGDAIMQFRFDAGNGTLSPNDPPAARVKAKAGPRHLAFHPDGTKVYVVNELDGTIDGFDYAAASGGLMPKQTISIMPSGFEGRIWAADVHVAPSGRFLYASDRGSHTLSVFSIDAHGFLTLVGHLPTEAQPRSFKIDPSGRWLLVVGETSHHMTSYAVNPSSGTLTAHARYPVGRTPNWVEVIELS